MKKQPVRETNPGPVPRSMQLAAACTVHDYAASRLLEVRQPGKLNEVPEREYFNSIFEFSRTELLEYIRANPGLAETLHGRSLDQRCIPSASMVDAPGGYKVGLVRRHRERATLPRMDRRGCGRLCPWVLGHASNDKIALERVQKPPGVTSHGTRTTSTRLERDECSNS